MRHSHEEEGRSVRLLRVGEQVRHALSDILTRGEVHDDTLASHMVSVTEVRMSPDLRHATVFVKPLLGKDEEAVLKALRTNTAYLQREVAHRVKVKYAAKLKFLADESFDEGTHIDTLLRNKRVAPALKEGEGGGGALRTTASYRRVEGAERVKWKYAAKLKVLADESFDEGTDIDTLRRNPRVARDLGEVEG